MATTLMTSGRFTPCQTARLYSGMSAPRMLCAAVARNGPTVYAGNTPTSRHMNTSSALGNSIQRGGSRRARQVGGRRPEEHLQDEAQRIGHAEGAGTVAASGSPTRGPVAATKVVWRRTSFEMKPLSSGTPAMDAAATMASGP